MTDILTRPLAPTAPVGDLDEALTCVGVVDETHDVKTFLLVPQTATPAFSAGQYLTVTVNVAGENLQRCYTISSAPNRPETLAITVKRVPDGPVSNWLHDNLRAGDQLWATGPHGDFSHTRHPAGKYLFLSAGSGITPMMSMTRTLQDDIADIVFVHSARTPDDIIFRDELETMASGGRVVLTVICEADSPAETWRGPTGRLGLRTLLAVPDLHDREIFTCGPAGYMTAAREALAQCGVDPARCHEELFDLAARGAAAAMDEQDLSGTRYDVRLRRTGRTVDCAANETLLHAAQRAGLNPPSMCAEGMCGTCRMALLAGEVDMQHQGGIRQRDVDRGEILICCSTPTGDVVLDA